MKSRSRKHSGRSLKKGILKNRKLLALILIAVICLTIVPMGLNTYVPGPEGPNVIAYGATIGNLGSTVYCAGNYTPALPNGATDIANKWTWVNNAPSQMSLKHIKYGSGEEISTRYREDNGIVTTSISDATLAKTDVKTIEFSKYVKVSDNQYKITKMTVSTARLDFKINIYSDPSGGYYTFKNVKLWYNLDTAKWTNAFNADSDSFAPAVNDTTVLQDAIYRGAYPLNAWIEDYTVMDWTKKKGSDESKVSSVGSGAQQKIIISPSEDEHTIDLFTKPSMTWDKVTNYQAATDQQYIQMATQADALPDGRFAEDVYFYISLDSFGAYVEDGNIWGEREKQYYPSVQLDVSVQYAIYGEFVYLWTTEAAEDIGYNPDEWHSRNSTMIYYQSPISKLFEGIGDWWGGNSFPIYMIMVLAILILVAYMVGPAIRSASQSFANRPRRKQ